MLATRTHLLSTAVSACRQGNFKGRSDVSHLSEFKIIIIIMNCCFHRKRDGSVMSGSCRIMLAFIECLFTSVGNVDG